jgi:hypothetical protein
VVVIESSTCTLKLLGVLETSHFMALQRDSVVVMGPVPQVEVEDVDVLARTLLHNNNIQCIII